MPENPMQLRLPVDDMPSSDSAINEGGESPALIAQGDRARSLILGRDQDVISIILSTHCKIATPRILDCTYNRGVMWKGLPYHPTTMDIDPAMGTDVVGDCRDMPFPDDSFDVIAFDPPHLPVGGHSDCSSQQLWNQRYGITKDKGMGRDGDNVSDLFLPFLAEAKRVLRDDGIVMAKIADLVHNHRQQWQHIDFINVARSLYGLTACDLIVKGDPAAGNRSSSKWKTVKHVRKAHCYWIVVRNSTHCE